MPFDVSVIIPTYKRDQLLAQCLRSLSVQDYSSGNIEIIVIDDSGRRSVDDLRRKLAFAHPHFQVLTQDHKGPAAARNLGVRSARGQIICFTDDDCSVAPDWISRMVRAHEQHPRLSAVGGMTLTATNRTTVLASQYLANGSIDTFVNGKIETVFFPTCNVSFKRQVIADNAFDEFFPFPGGEDLEIFWRLFKAGHRFLWDKGIDVTHYREDTLRSFIKQAYIYGRGNYLVQYLHKDQPLLHELKTGAFEFWGAVLINFLKIPRFSYTLGRCLIREANIVTIGKKAEVYAHFALHKVFYIAGNIVEYFRVRKDLPVVLSPKAVSLPRLLILDITHSCNLSCRICDIWQTGRTEVPLELEQVKALLSQAKALGIREIALSGGEVLLRKDIFEIFDHARSVGIRELGVLTNGILAGSLLERLKPYLLDQTLSLVISLDSLNAAVHDQIRNYSSAWQKTTDALRSLSELKKRHPQVNFNVISIVLNENLEELPALIDFVRALGANSLQFQALLPNNLMMAERKGSHFWVTRERWVVLDRTIDQLVSIKEKDPDFIRNSVQNLLLIKKYYREELTSDDAQCLSADRTVLVANQGMCVTCFSSYGNIREQGLKEILSGRKRIEAQERVKKCKSPCLLPCFCDS